MQRDGWTRQGDNILKRGSMAHLESCEVWCNDLQSHRRVRDESTWSVIQSQGNGVTYRSAEVKTSTPIRNLGCSDKGRLSAE